MAAIQNYRFAVVRKPEPPWTLVECMREDRSTSFLNFVRRCNGKYGAAVDATILMAEYLQWNISFIWSSTWGSLLNGTWVGAVGDVMRHEAESCIPQVSPNYARSTAVDFAGYMFMEQKTCFAFCHSAQHVVTFKLSRLFQDPWLVGGLFLLTIFAFGFVFHMIRWSPEGVAVEATDPVLNDPKSLAEVLSNSGKGAGSIETPQPHLIDCEFTWSNWDSCDTLCGKGTKQRYTIVSVLPEYNGALCPKNETEECTGDSCTIDALPEGSGLLKLGTRADGNKWPFNASAFSGLGKEPPYPNAQLAAAVLPDGATVLVPLNPEDPATDDIDSLCNKVPYTNGGCPEAWVLKGEMCIVLQKTAADGKCPDGQAVEAGDPILNDPQSLAEVAESGPIDVPVTSLPPIDCVFTWSNWGYCDAICGKGSRKRKPVVSVPAAHNGTHCPENAETDQCDGDSCTMDTLPEGSELIKLGIKADGNIWPFNVSAFPGLAAQPPFPDAEVAAGVLPDGSSVFLPLDPVDPATDQMNVLCKQEPKPNGLCPDKWLLNGKLCFVLQKNGICLQGESADVGDPIMNDLNALAQLTKRGPIEVKGAIDKDPTDCWGGCSVTCGIGERHNIKKKEPSCSKMPDKQLCFPKGCPLDCLYKWGIWGICSAPCDDGRQFRSPQVKQRPEYGGKTCPSVQQQPCNNHTCPTIPTDLTPTTVTTTTTTPTSTTTKLITTTPVFPLDEVEEVVVSVLQTLGCTFLLIILGITVVVFLILRDFSYERFLHMNMEIALFVAHVLVLTMRDRTDLPVPCKLASIGLQYFFTVSFAFMALEALQAYAITTMVITSGGYFSRFQFFLIGWGCPAVITLLSAMFKHNDYTSYWSCWTNLGDDVAMATVVPIAGFSAAAVVISEAAGMREFPMLPGISKDQATAALANSKGLLIILPCAVASWFTGLFAVYYANLAMFSLVAALNIALGAVIFVFHSLGNPKVHAIFKKLYSKICQKKPGNRAENQ